MAHQLSNAEEKRIADFLEKVAELPPEKLRMVALAELSWIFNRKKADGQKYSELTNRNLVIAYRHAIVEKFGEESKAGEYLKYSPARVDKYKAHQAATRVAKHHSVRPLDPDAYMNTALLLLGEVMLVRWSNPKAIAALCALTGRRPVEVALRGHFEPDPDDRYQVIFSGQVKTRDDERTAAAYAIPILGDRELILEAIERLRSEIDQNIDNKSFSAKYNKEIGLASKKAFQDFNGTPLIPSDLREAYAAVAYFEYGDESVLDIAYKCRVLGHKYMDTTLDYLGFRIKFDD